MKKFLNSADVTTFLNSATFVDVVGIKDDIKDAIKTNPEWQTDNGLSSFINYLFTEKEIKNLACSMRSC